MGKRTDYDPSDHFFLRSPLFPTRLLSSIPVSQETLEPWLRNHWENPLFREGISLASIDFAEISDRYFSREARITSDNQVLWTLLRYACRFASRCTPFGTFAGFAAGTFGNETFVTLKNPDKHLLHARPDMEYLLQVARVFESVSDNREKLSYTGNSTLYRIGQVWHYVEVKMPEGKKSKHYDIVTVDDGGVIGGLLAYCTNGRRPAELREYLMEKGCDAEEAGEFVDTLIREQILISNLQAVVCGREYLDNLLGQLEEAANQQDLTRNLGLMSNSVANMNRLGKVAANLPALESVVKSVPVAYNRNHLIQADMMLGADFMVLDHSLNGQVLLGLRIMKSLSRQERPDSLVKFREVFTARYGRRKVPLVRVLDPEAGIGPDETSGGYWTDPVPWIEDLGWGPPAGLPVPVSGLGHPWLAGKLTELIAGRQLYLEITQADLRSIGIHDGDWPLHMTAMIEVAQGEKEHEPLIHLIHGSPGNPAFLLGRFGFTDPALTGAWIARLLEEERQSDPDTIFAEVVHLPEDRTGNVLQRPAFHAYEIPYLAASLKEINRRVPISDLLVSVEDGEVVLTSETLGKRVRPCMTNAYNHQLGHLSVYKFLNRVSNQYSGPGFKPDWGNFHLISKFCPGIRFKNLILSAPVWEISKSEIAGWIRPEANQTDLDSINEWRNRRNMPIEMVWMASDHELYINWTNPNLVLAFWDAFRNRESGRFRPFYLSGDTPVKSPAGSHANQIILCYRKS